MFLIPWEELNNIFILGNVYQRHSIHQQSKITNLFKKIINSQTIFFIHAKSAPLIHFSFLYQKIFLAMLVIDEQSPSKK